jgi:hypothetical protein
MRELERMLEWYQDETIMVSYHSFGVELYRRLNEMKEEHDASRPDSGSGNRAKGA